MSGQNTTKEEEVDLGQLFKLIGKMFSNLFNFIGNIFKGAFRFLILVLIFLHRGLKWYVAAIVLGVVVGVVLDKTSEKSFGANLYIETNFNSSRQVYENMENLHALASVGHDSVELARILGLTVKQARTLKGFYIKPDFDENYMIEKYSDYYNRLDSISQLTASYTDYKENLMFYNFDIHQIGVASTDKFIYADLQKKLVEVISFNAYTESVKDVTLKNLDREMKMLNEQAKEIDTLVKEYLKIRIAESKKQAIPSGGTNLYMSGDSNSNTLIVDESKLVARKYALEARRSAIDSSRVKQQKVVNTLADFPNSGYDILEWTDKKKFVLPIVFFGLTFVASLLLLLRDYIEEQSDKLSKNTEEQ